jgi:adenylate kinase
VLLDRVTGRRSDPETGRVYHATFDPPPPEVAERLIQRKDDTAEVFAQRLEEYRSKTAPLVPYYERQGLLRRIDGFGAKDEIRRRIFDALGL